MIDINCFICVQTLPAASRLYPPTPFSRWRKGSAASVLGILAIIFALLVTQLSLFLFLSPMESARRGERSERDLGRACLRQAGSEIADI